MPGVSTTSTKAPGTQHMGHMTIAARPTLLIDMGYAYSSGAVVSTPTGYVSAANSPDIAPVLPFPTSLGVIAEYFICYRKYLRDRQQRHL